MSSKDQNMTPLIPISVKIALGVGTLVGATVALVNNKEAIYGTAENLFNKGAEYCRNKLEEAKIANQTHFADNYQDEELNTGRSTSSNLRNESDYEGISTPDTTDFSEIETDYNDEDEDDGKDIDDDQPDNASLD
ncbi:hypothetical protein Cantr_06369 [Candida viswanathii]|uniref:Uncharacterized protein n=1 Tax=Candida viswanathii TaxID=5486 RepID=A0A367XX21_9ASCO|nr:hypothetical protein Cantr_06369 [Candida viswanathii]